MTDLEKAIADLKEEYEKALSYEWVCNPLAYALFLVWRKWDAKKRWEEGE